MMTEQEEKVTRDLLDALKEVQFSFNLSRCSLCAGWNMGPYGETDGIHTLDCPVKLAIEQAEAYLAS